LKRREKRGRPEKGEGLGEVKEKVMACVTVYCVIEDSILKSFGNLMIGEGGKKTAGVNEKYMGRIG